LQRHKLRTYLLNIALTLRIGSLPLRQRLPGRNVLCLEGCRVRADRNSPNLRKLELESEPGDMLRLLNKLRLKLASLALMRTVCLEKGWRRGGHVGFDGRFGAIECGTHRWRIDAAEHRWGRLRAQKR